MKKKYKNMLKEILLDIKHWLGWALTTGAVVGVFHLIGVHLHQPLWHIAVLFGVIVGVDIVKHLTKLQ